MKEIESDQKIIFGSYPYSKNGECMPISWIVLDTVGTKALLLSEMCLDAIPYDELMESVTWEKCSLRKILNEKLINEMFSDEERKALLLTSNDNPDSPLYYAKGGEPSNGGKSTSDYLFPLTIEDVEKYFPDEVSRRAKLSPYAISKGAFSDEDGCGYWWLRNPGMRNINAAYVRYNGSVVTQGYFVNSRDFAIRPAMWLDIQ